MFECLQKFRAALQQNFFVSSVQIREHFRVAFRGHRTHGHLQLQPRRVFDLLAEDGKTYLSQTLSKRRILLERFARLNFQSAKDIHLSPATIDLLIGREWFEKVGGDLDGVIAKRLDATYASGDRTAMIKVKRIRTADCVIGGFRYASGTRLIGLFCLGFMVKMDCSTTSDSHLLSRR